MLMNDEKIEIHPLEDTDRIQKAIEAVVDDETAALPLLPDLDDLPAEETLPTASHETADVMTDAPVHSWFFTFMCMNIPVIGWFYLFYLAFNKKKSLRRNFARAYLYYKLLFLIISAVILGVLIYIGMGMLDQLLAYMQML